MGTGLPIKESQHRNLQVSFHKLPFRNVLPLDHHTQAHLAALISGYLGNDYVAGNLNMRGRTVSRSTSSAFRFLSLVRPPPPPAPPELNRTLVVLSGTWAAQEVSVDLAGLHRTLHVPSDGTPGRVRELVAARANRHTSEIAAVAPDVLSELRPAMADRIFVELRWTNTDYVRRMEGLLRGMLNLTPIPSTRNPQGSNSNVKFPTKWIATIALSTLNPLQAGATMGSRRTLSNLSRTLKTDPCHVRLTERVWTEVGAKIPG